MYLNKVILYGRLGADPELKTLPSGVTVVNFSLATTRTWKKDGQKQEQTEWHRCVCFDKRAEVIQQYVHKGDKFYVEGRLQTRSWEQDGVKKYSTEVMLDNFEFGDNPRRTGQGSAPQAQQGGAPASAPAQAAPKAKEELETIEYPEEDINPEEIPF